MELQTHPSAMMARTVFVSVMILSVTTSSAQQNLVVNGSFEEIETCDLNMDAINYAGGWSNFYSSGGSSVDLFNTCSTNSSFDIPRTYILDSAYSGAGCAGFLARGINEAPMGTLSDTLLKDTAYSVSFKVALCLNCNKAVKNLGLMFLDTILQVPLEAYDTLMADIIDTTYIATHGEWHLVTGEYVGKGNEINFMIGLFPPFGFNDLLPVSGSTSGAYYLLDDVVVHKASEGGPNGISDRLIELSVYPNPAVNRLSIRPTERLSKVWIVDLHGRRLKSLEDFGGYWEADVSSLVSGIYLIEATAEDGRKEVRKVVKGP